MVVTTRWNEPRLPRDSMPFIRQVMAAINELEKATGRSVFSDLNANKAQNSSIDLVSSQIVDINARVDAAIAAITLDMSQVPTGTLDQSRVVGTWTKDVSTSGTVQAGAVNSPGITGSVVVGGDVYAQSLATNITATRVALWGRTADGYIATATSSRSKKGNIEVADIDPLAVLSLEPKHYQWIAELRKRDDPGYEDYIGPWYHVHTEVGMIAEELHDRGLWQFVVYERDTNDQPVLRDGQPVPVSIHYSLLGVMSLAVERYLHELILGLFDWVEAQDARLDRLEAAVANLLPRKINDLR